MLKHGLKVDRVHTYVSLSLSQLEEKITWVMEKTTSKPLNLTKLQGQFTLVVIVTLGDGFFLKTEKEHKEGRE